MAQTFDVLLNTAQTIGAVTSTLISYELPENCVAIIEGKVLGVETGGLLTAWRFTFVARRVTGDAVLPTPSGGGSAANYILGFRETTLTDGAGNPIAKSGVSGTSVLIEVDGLAGFTIDWRGEMRLQIVT